MAKIYKIILFFLLLGFAPLSADAANLYFSPSSGSHAVGTTFSVSVYVSSADQAINAASGAISFPKDKLEAASLSKTDSIFTLWVQEPSFSNSAGTVNFEGIVLNPGFTGATGKILTINFRTKATGLALVNFSSGLVLSNDGKGTNILASLGNIQFSLGGAAPTVPESTTPSVERPVFLKLGSWAVSLLAVAVPLVALVILLLFITWYGWHKFSMFRKKLKKEVREAESALHKAFDLLKEDIREQVKMLEKTKNKRELTEEEEKVIKQLKKDLDDAEKFVRKEIEDIEREVK